VKPTSDDPHSGAAMGRLYRANDAVNRALSRSEAGRAYARLVTLTAYVDRRAAIDAASFASERGSAGNWRRLFSVPSRDRCTGDWKPSSSTSEECEA